MIPWVLKSGEPWELEDKNVVTHTCCDCENRHLVQIDIEGKKVSLRFYRDNFATEKARKEEGIVLYRRKK